MSEKRDYLRFKFNVPMKYLVPPQQRKVAAILVDISGTGLLFKTPEEVKTRQELLLYLSLGDRNIIEIHAKAVRVEREPGQARSFYVGVRIADKMKFDERKFVKFYAELLIAAGKK